MNDVVRIMLLIWTALVLSLGHKFVDAKIKNDSSIAEDTRRIADALTHDRCFASVKTTPQNGLIVITSKRPTIQTAEK